MHDACSNLGCRVASTSAACPGCIHVLALQVKRHRAEENLSSEEEEQALSIICNLLQNLPRGQKRERVAAKFVENEFEKVDRLLELYHRYWSRLIAEQVSLV